MSLTNKIDDEENMETSIKTIEWALNQITGIPNVGPIRVSLENISEPEFVVYTTDSALKDYEILLHQIDTILRIKAGLKSARIHCKKL